MAVFRTEKTEDFTIMSNYHFKDRRLSMKSKGLLSMILSLPDDWQYSLSGLAAMNKEGLTAIRATVRELEDNGMLTRWAWLTPLTLMKYGKSWRNVGI